MFGELQRSGDESGVVVHESVAGGFLHDRLHFFKGEGGGDLVLRLNPHQLQDVVRGPVKRRNDGLDQPPDEHQRRRQQQRRLVRDGHGDVLGHHFAERDVQERHQQQGDGEGHNVRDLHRDAHRFQRHGQEVVDRGLGHLQDQQRADGDAELGAGEHEGNVFHRPQCGLGALGTGLGQRLDLAAAGRHDGEFGGHEEGVAHQEERKPEDSCPVAHAAPAWLAGWPSPDTRMGRKQIRSIRRPSMRVTLSVPPTTSTVSPTAAMRPSWLMT